MPPASAPSPRGLWFEEFEAGQEHRSAERRLCQEDVDAFAALTGDENPIHLDAEFARRSPFRGRIAHGLLVESIASGLAWRMGIFRGSIVALSRIEIEFLAPVKPPAALRVVLRVLAKDPEPSVRRGWVRFATEVETGDGTLVLRGSWQTLLQRAPQTRTDPH